MAVAVILILSAIISKHFLQLMLIQGRSMEPAYHSLQLVVLNKNFSDDDITPGKVVAFRCRGVNAVLVKRIAAVPGQSVVIKNATLYVDGVPSDTYPKGSFNYSGILTSPVLLKDDEFIAIGDNIAESVDSRYEEIGIVKRDSILGIVY